MFDAKKMSAAIRMKKKSIKEASPGIIDTSPKPDMDAQDVYDMEQHGRVEETLNSPDKIDSDETMMDDTFTGVGLSPDEKMRMKRLQEYMDGLDLDMDGE